MFLLIIVVLTFELVNIPKNHMKDNTALIPCEKLSYSLEVSI